MSAYARRDDLALDGALAEIARLKRRVRELEEELAEYSRQAARPDPAWRRVAISVMMRWGVPTSPAVIAATLALAPPGAVVSHQAIADGIAAGRRAGLWTSGVRDSETSLDNLGLFVKRLRDALYKRGVKHGGVLSVRGVGYTMTAEARALVLEGCA